jgi:hypothetical protein
LYNFTQFKIIFTNLLNFSLLIFPLWTPLYKIWIQLMQNTVCYFSIMKTVWLGITN